MPEAAYSNSKHNNHSQDMTTFLFSNWWKALDFAKQSYWVLAVVFSIFLIIFLIMSVFEHDIDSPKESKPSGPRIFSARTILIFLTISSWSLLGGTYLSLSWIIRFIVAISLGLILTFVVRKLMRSSSGFTPLRSSSNEEHYIERTGRVLQYIPSHRNGFGKVHLDLRGAPYELEAMTAGSELKAGDKIKVIDIIEDRVLVVEPLKNGGYPHEEHQVNRL
jgi:membrane protein implicated in regulation of membrane protease activity